VGILLMRDRQLRAPAGVSADLTCRLPAGGRSQESLDSLRIVPMGENEVRSSRVSLGICFRFASRCC
jgi:hypothetical protein